jgi:hypothetical protein
VLEQVAAADPDKATLQVTRLPLLLLLLNMQWSILLVLL